MLDSGPDTAPDSRPTRRGGGAPRDALTPAISLLLAPAAAYVLTRLGIELVDRALDATGGEPMTDAGGEQLLAIAMAAVAFLLTVRTRLSARSAVPVWAATTVERPVRDVLADLPEDYHVVTGVSVGDGDVIDHLVIGPTGVFSIETRTYSCGVVIDRGRALVNGRSLEGLVAQVSHTAASLGRVARCPVTPVICAYGGVRVDAFLASPVVDGVRFCDEAHLVRTITTGRSVLSQGARDRIEVVVGES